MVAILLSTYNGEKYLDVQIQSIMNQTYKDFVLYIRDDNSIDKTQTILASYARKYPNKIILLNAAENVGSTESFFILLSEAVDCEGYFFCDQDDYWYDNKVETFLQFYNSLNEDERNKPVLIHSGANVTDSNLNIDEELTVLFNKNKGQHNNDILWNVFSNDVTGCVTFINNNMKKKCMERKPYKIIQHDWFCSMVATYYSTKYYIDDNLIEYRQHDSNSIGIRKGNVFKAFINKVVNITKRKITYPYYDQVNALLSLLNYEDNDNYKKLKDFANLSSKTKIKRVIWHIRYNFFKNTNLVYRIYQLFIC